jgi:flagellar basal body L-ring protein FlgH
MRERPPLTLRVFVLIAAIACLGLAMCAYSEHSKPPNPPAPPQQAQPQQAPPQQPQPQKPEEGKMSKEKPRYFPATKAPGSFR